MTQDKNHGPDDRNWMDIAREDAINEVRHNGQRLPFIAAAVSLLIIGGGAVFAQTNNEAPAQAVPVIPNVSPKVNGYYEDDDDDEEDDDEEEDDEEEDDEEEDDD
jgi:hypothetical protein